MIISQPVVLVIKRLRAIVFQKREKNVEQDEDVLSFLKYRRKIRL